MGPASNQIPLILDQVNVALPRSLAGRGDIEVTLSVDSNAANTVGVTIK